MRIYHVFHTNYDNHPTVKIDYSKYVRSFEIARKIIREETGGSAIMLDHQKCPAWEFTMSWEIKAIDFDNTKDGVLELLNEQIFHNREVVFPPKVSDTEAFTKHLEDLRLDFPPKTEELPTVSPCIQYDNFPAEKTGKCLHCNKTVGYVGGMPRVNPPESIRD